MTSWRDRLLRLLGSEKGHIGVLALVALIMHLAIINQFDYFIFDEYYYVRDANRILAHGDGLRAVHPSLGKLFIATGIRTFGFNPWGWRLLPVIFTVASVILLYLICRKLAGKRTALLAGFLFIFENLVFYFAGLAMLDPFAMTFMLLAFLLYLEDSYALAGICIALGALCKLTGLFGAFVILGHWIIARRGQGIRHALLFSIALLATFFLLMPVTDFAASGEWLNPIERLRYLAFNHVGTKTGELPLETQAVTLDPWIFLLKPVCYDVYYADGSVQKVLITPTIWVLIMPSMIYMAYEWVRNRAQLALFSLLWFCGTYVVWIPLVLISGTYAYLFYFVPTVGAVCMAIACGLMRIWDTGKERRTAFGYVLRAAVVAYTVTDVAVFLAFSPILTLLAPHVFVRGAS